MYVRAMLRILLLYFLWTMGILYKADYLNFSETPSIKLVIDKVIEFGILVYITENQK